MGKLYPLRGGRGEVERGRMGAENENGGGYHPNIMLKQPNSFSKFPKIMKNNNYKY
jgi:hypothetical protein